MTMVEQSDHAPLLDWEEVPSGEPPTLAPRQRDESEAGPANCRSGGSTTPGAGWTPSTVGSVPVPGVGGEEATTCAGSVYNGSGWENKCPAKGDGTLSGWGAVSDKDRRLSEWEEKDQIVAVFVVTFDTRSGE